MILNRTYGFLFVHVPKTAGMAVSRELRRFTMERDLDFCEPYDEVNMRRAEASGLSKHSTAAEIREVIGEEEFNSLFKFAFVRDPYARTYSLFRFLKYNFRQWKNSAVMDTFDSFDDFVSSDFFQTPGPDRIFEPQDLWLTDDNGRLLVDQTAHMEELDTELAAIYGRVGLPPLRRVKPINVSGKQGRLWQLANRLPLGERVRQLIAPQRIEPIDLAEIYANDETRRIVKARYERGFGMFGYSSQLSDLAANRISSASVAASRSATSRA